MYELKEKQKASGGHQERKVNVKLADEWMNGMKEDPVISLYKRE